MAISFLKKIYSNFLAKEKKRRAEKRAASF